MPPLKEGFSHETIGQNIKELRKSGHPLKSAIAASLSLARKSKLKHMAEGGDVEKQEPSDLVQEGEMMADSHEAMGPEFSDERDVVESGAAMKPIIPEDLDKGSPAHNMDEAGTMTPQLMEILKKKKSKYA